MFTISYCVNVGVSALRVRWVLSISILLLAVKPVAAQTADGIPVGVLPEMSRIREIRKTSPPLIQSFSVSFDSQLAFPKGSDGKDSLSPQPDQSLPTKDLLLKMRTRIDVAPGLMRVENALDDASSTGESIKNWNQRNTIVFKDGIRTHITEHVNEATRSCSINSYILENELTGGDSSPILMGLTTNYLDNLALQPLRYAYSKEGAPLVVVGAPNDASSNYTIEYYLDPAMDYRLVKRTSQHKKAKFPSADEIHYVPYPQGGWVPDYSVKHDQIGEHFQSHFHTITSLKINEPLDPALFELTLPAGTKVDDMVNKRRYVVGSLTAGEQWIADQLVAVEKLKVQ